MDCVEQTVYYRGLPFRYQTRGPRESLKQFSVAWPNRASFLLPTRPSARAASRPAEVRSRIIARSNSAKASTICIIIRPAEVVVSTFQVFQASTPTPRSSPALRTRRRAAALLRRRRIRRVGEVEPTCHSACNAPGRDDGSGAETNAATADPFSRVG